MNTITFPQILRKGNGTSRKCKEEYTCLSGFLFTSAGQNLATKILQIKLTLL